MTPKQVLKELRKVENVLEQSADGLSTITVAAQDNRYGPNVRWLLSDALTRTLDNLDTVKQIISETQGKMQCQSKTTV